MPDVIPVRQIRSLPPASYKDTLTLGYELDNSNPHSGLTR